MDAQMKRGFLEACVLATLRRRESYGYQIIKDVPASLGLTESSLYPLLKRLEGNGMVAERSAEHNGRLRKYYRITAAGQDRLRAFLAEQDEVRGLYRYVEESILAPEPACDEATDAAGARTAAAPALETAGDGGSKAPSALAACGGSEELAPPSASAPARASRGAGPSGASARQSAAGTARSGAMLRPQGA
ncbi:PadR family transcriptional regulator [Adlercreutzia faecimuris]|uniref:PadR family transcriptional regulator n=1 Tax=Adlercreutzia faecimuris TaxID=2897341 RepID=A0ABS9WE42_9ACTN|nr:PadR family transcriptional regulator [Adlercreutzia sp. JBNU-10]MCI2241139.1 PadR family transcriptional regulator [Adlercreutzia sp. JBNU-10]